MKTPLLLIMIALLESVSTARLPAQSAPIARGEKISAVPPPPRETDVTKTNTPSAAATATNQPAAIQNGDFFGFEKLAGFSLSLTRDLEYSTNASVADARVNALIPAALHAADGKMIRVNGYMTPLDYDKGKTKLFILSRDPPGCCFGDMPLIHEMIEVRMKGEGVPVRSYLPVQVRGVLHVGPKRNGDLLACIYRLDGETVDEAEQ